MKLPAKPACCAVLMLACCFVLLRLDSSAPGGNDFTHKGDPQPPNAAQPRRGIDTTVEVLTHGQAVPEDTTQVPWMEASSSTTRRSSSGGDVVLGVDVCHKRLVEPMNMPLSRGS